MWNMQGWQFWVKAFPPRLARTSIQVKELQRPNHEPYGEGDFGGRKSFWLCDWASPGPWPPQKVMQTRLALEGDHLVTLSVEARVSLWGTQIVCLYSSVSVPVPQLFFWTTGHLLVILRAILNMECFRRSCSDCICTQMDLGSYQSLRQMKVMVPGDNRYENVADIYIRDGIKPKM